MFSTIYGSPIGARRALMLIGLLVCLTATASASGQFDHISELGIRELRVEGSMLDVEVRGSSRLAVDGRGESIPDSIEVKYERRGDVLRVWVERRFALFSTRRDGKLIFDVPEGIDLEVRTSSGSVDIQDMSSGNLFAGASSGSVRMKRIKSEMNARSSSGNIVLEDIRGDTNVEASSGRIEVRDANGELTVAASSGDVRLFDIDGDVNVSASSGKIEIEGIKGALRAKTSSGGIEGEDIWITGDSTFLSSSGGIDIDFDNPLSAFSFRLSSSSGGLKIGDLEGQKNLLAGAGVFQITGETSSGSQRYR